MKIVLISDTHCFQNEITMPPGDIVIHAGDFTHIGAINEYTPFLEWFSNLPYKHKVLICGNHEREIQKDYYLFKSAIPENITFLENSGAKIEGLRIWGSPWTPAFKDWGFMYYTEDEAKAIWSQIPDNIDILVTHGPAYRYLDFSTFQVHAREDQNVGCKILRKAIEKIQPKLHVCGHIHGNRGTLKAGKTRMVNAAICDEAYKASNKPFIVDTKTWEVSE